MDLNNRVIQLCSAGTRAEYERRLEDAQSCYWQAWQAVTDDFEACVAAHYVARFQADPAECLRWNQVALARAQAVGDGRAASFFPSLYLSLGRAYELAGDTALAQENYLAAERLGVRHQPGPDLPQ
jgi:hypothetical protein